MRFKILFTLWGLLLLAGCGAVDDVGRVVAQNSDEIARLTTAILANVDETARAGSLLGDDAAQLSSLLVSKYGDDAGRVVSQAASQYGDDFASQGRYIDDLVLPILDDTDEYARLISQQDAELGLLASFLDEFQLKNLAPDLLCLNLDNFLSEGEPAGYFDYSDLIAEKIGRVVLITEVMEIYEQSKQVIEFAEQISRATSASEMYYRLRLKSMCASLK